LPELAAYSLKLLWVDASGFENMREQLRFRLTPRWPVRVKAMQRTPIKSTSIKSAGYSEGILEIEFQDGSVYRYTDVPAEAAQAFMASDSKGRHFMEFIRDQYESEEVKT
jgi:KTSC domain-containing protein